MLDQHQRPARRRQSVFSVKHIFFITFALLAAIIAAMSGVLFYRKQQEPAIKQGWIDDDYYLDGVKLESLTQFLMPPDPNLVTELQERHAPQQEFRIIPGADRLSYKQIFEQLLKLPKITLVENGPQGKPSSAEIVKKGQAFKKDLAASIADSSNLAHFFAARCLREPIVQLQLLEKMLAISPHAPSAWDAPDGGGMFQCSDATLYFFRQNNLPYLTAAHELVHCGAAAMGINNTRLPFPHLLLAKTYPCSEKSIFEAVKVELQTAVLNYQPIITMDDESVLASTKDNSGLQKLLETANHFNPIFQILMTTTDFARLKDQHRLRRGTIVPSNSIVRRSWHNFLPNTIFYLPDKQMQRIFINQPTASNSPFKILNVVKTYAPTVAIIGTPTELSSVVRAKFLIMKAIVAMTYANSFSDRMQCPELFAQLISDFPDAVLRNLLPNFYAQVIRDTEEDERQQRAPGVRN